MPIPAPLRRGLLAVLLLGLFAGPVAAEAGTATAGGGSDSAATRTSAPARTAGGEASLVLPDLNSVTFLGLGGRDLLFVGLVVSALGLAFGLV
ncbi:MAG: hypothetical protein K2X87_28805, partial [Gemmataceae bacterium]|nr:hypothetical protein [Gemmataceae bacterium]